ncbi:ERF family protein [Clostridium sp.]|uniref:ERF family protein n=1 Tax=Clostridium sp. TaxID=1506 RepID=UPI0032163916
MSEVKEPVNKLNIYQKLQRARVELQNKELKKSGYNKYSDYKYFELGDFLPYINEICDVLGLYCEFQFAKEKAILLVIDSENPEELRTWSTPVEIATLKGCSSIQNIGGSQSYARRYLYLMAFEIAESDTVDGGEIDQDAEEGKAKISKAAVMTIKKLIDETSTEENKFLGWAGVSKVEDIQNSMLGTCINMLNKKKIEIEELRKKKEEEENFNF